MMAMADTRTPSLSPNSVNSEDDSLELQEVGEKSLWILSRQGVTKDVDQEAEALSEEERLALENEELKNENEELKEKLNLAESGEKDATKKLEQKQKEITNLERQLQVGGINQCLKYSYDNILTA